MKFTFAEMEKCFMNGEGFPAPDGFILMGSCDAVGFKASSWSGMVAAPDSEVLPNGCISGRGGWPDLVKAVVVAYYNCAIEWKAGKAITYNEGVTTFTQWLQENISNPLLEDPYRQELGSPDQVWGLYRKEMEQKYSKR